MKKLWRVLFSRTMFFALMALVQIGLFFALVLSFSQLGTVAYILSTILAVLIIILICEKDSINPAYKLSWILLVVTFPFSGVLFYILFGGRGLNKKRSAQFGRIEQNVVEAMRNSGEVRGPLEKEDASFNRCVHYLNTMAAAPLYPATESKYFAWGQDFFTEFCAQVKQAKKYIFMEYFILEEGDMWDTTLALLVKKAQEGVDVRIIFDSLGCLFTLPDRYEEILHAAGIKCEVFNPLRFTLHISDYTMLNHRDHRKITVVDGEVGFTGGVNFADEYINIKQRFGKWKDTALMIKGPGVFSLTVTFLKMWDFIAHSETKYADFKPETRFETDGYVQPYCDSPIDEETVSENAYLNIIQRAQRYVTIATPYLVIDHEMLTALCLAAKSGVEVNIITPGIPDKWYVFYITQSYYPELIKAGVHIFEYKPGFIHAKMYVSDDEVAVVGSANMDYRSLYLHFENCVAFYGGHMPRDVRDDLNKTITESRAISFEETQKTPFIKRILQMALRFVAPMM